MNEPRHGPDVVTDEDNGAFGTPTRKGALSEAREREDDREDEELDLDEDE